MSKVRNSRLFLFVSCVALTACRIQKADHLVERNLKIIYRSVNHDRDLNIGKVGPAIIFLETTTNIISESDGNYFGRYQPTLNDYNRWSTWYNRNRGDIYWDKIEKKVKVIK